ncbi:MAG: Folylpolyglutamate synthase [Eubacteriales bacterium SKADARSKE-1]|nr:Folylpolyglutamate synthase [Eubacteriales bacterium SKADARSKE-1]
MTYEETLNEINKRLKFGIKPGLSRIKKLLNLMGNPQNNLKFIHVAGTNGKGSTCTMLASVLNKSKYKTGLFISPFILDFRERLQVNGKMVSKKELTFIFEKVKPHLDKLEKAGEIITEFELITAMAFLYFSINNCDIVVLEVGLGGKFDATNVVKSPLVSIITSISLDHTNILGDTIEKIAHEKAGIIKPNSTVVLYPQEQKSITCIIKKIARQKSNKLIEIDQNNIKILKSSVLGTEFEYKNKKYFLSLAGNHQVKNALVVLETINELKTQHFNISQASIKSTFKNIMFPSRLEIISKSPLVIMDGAHNLDGISKLKDFITQHLNEKKIIAIVGMLRDKDYENSFSKILPTVSKTIVVEINNPRTLKENEIFNVASKFCKDVTFKNNLKDASNYAFSICDNNSAILVFGSLYLASAIRPILLKIIKSASKKT